MTTIPYNIRLARDLYDAIVAAGGAPFVRAALTAAIDRDPPPGSSAEQRAQDRHASWCDAAEIHERAMVLGDADLVTLAAGLVRRLGPGGGK